MGETGILGPQVRCELIEGEIIDMSPIGSRHAGTVSHLSRLLNRAAGNSAVIAVQNPVILNDNSEPEPDIALLKPRADFYRNAHPNPEDILLIIEVADASLRYDRDIKIPLYARSGIPEVWLVDLQAGRLEIFRAPAATEYAEVQAHDLAQPLAPKALSHSLIEVSELFA
jgi:Uma2 family endonuclease